MTFQNSAVAAIAVQEFVVRALFDDPAAIQEDDAIGALHRPQSMRDQHHRPARHQAFDAFVHGRLVHRIQCRWTVPSSRRGRWYSSRFGHVDPRKRRDECFQVGFM
ncbi:hypothetical protein ACIHDR_18050 [Nocardia sp. NPDC052278]|uniref:hypothetical protein n=1 Tax=unclassified Nocardia TaxID=2637762 RepID=UPI00367F0E86